MIKLYQDLGYNKTSEFVGVDTYRAAYDNAGRIVYEGFADAGTLETAARWAIKKYSYEIGTGLLLDKKWADGDIAFDNIWANRESLTYA
jgi:hypothetical protein